MKLQEFYKSHYDLELVRKTDLTSALSIPVGVLSLMVGALVIMAKDLHFPLSTGEIAELTAIIVSGLASLISGYLLFRSLYNFAYGYIATPLAIYEYRAQLATYHESLGLLPPDARNLAEEETLEFIESEYAKYADRNAKNNDIKSAYLHRANGAMVASVFCGGIAAVAYVLNSILSPTPVPKIEVVNLKEVLTMTSPTTPTPTPTPSPSPTSAAPTPVTPPQGGFRPIPPPGRIIKEDRMPPRPPQPAEK